MNRIYKNLALVIGISILSIACETIDYEDTDLNPNGSTTGVPSLLLTGAQTSVVTIITDVTPILYMQHLTEGQYPGASRYENVAYSYNNWYTGPIQNLNDIIRINEDEDLKAGALSFGYNDNQIAVAKILRVYFLSYMTDRWGYLPWSEAFQGIDGPQPKFDTQESLYNYMFDEIDGALALINEGEPGPKGDIIFPDSKGSGGDMARWKVWANTMQMTMALRISDANPSLAKSKFEQAVASGDMITTNDENIVWLFGSDDNSDNPWEDRFESREDYVLSTTLVEVLRTNLDPRLFKYGEPARDSVFQTPLFASLLDSAYVGAENGKVNGDVPNYSFPTRTIIDDPQFPLPVYTLTQVKFSMAEAALNGWNVGGGTAATLFKEGIEASMGQWGVDADDITAYTDAHTSATIADIAYEKWVALYLNGPEAWAEWRRLDAPALTPSPYASVQMIPVRHGYSSSVEDNNPANYAKVVAEQGIDNLYTKLWWDKN